MRICSSDTVRPCTPGALPGLVAVAVAVAGLGGVRVAGWAAGAGAVVLAAAGCAMGFGCFAIESLLSDRGETLVGTESRFWILPFLSGLPGRADIRIVASCPCPGKQGRTASN